ncbi:MAG: hypothetical protein RL493_201, partial [Pseudomonadota bacterium]
MDANLLSAGKLVKEGYAAVLKRNILPGKDVIVTRDNQVVATGLLSHDNMFQMDGRVQETQVLESTRKTDERHIGHTRNCTCDICLQAKRRKSNKNTNKSTKYDINENLSVDMQGPLNVTSIDQAKYDMKIVDTASNYITSIPTTDKSARTTANIMRFYIKSSERQTGNRIKFIATDGGLEFYGDFLQLLT